MNVIETALPEVLLLEPKVFGDARGQVGWESTELALEQRQAGSHVRHPPARLAAGVAT